MNPLSVFIGWDSKEPMAASVLAHSIARHAKRPLAVTMLTRQSVGHVYTRERKPNEATEFSITRFLVPYLSQYRGWSLFMDSDQLARVDLHDVMLYPMADPGRAVYVAQHDYIPKGLTKFDGHEQTQYPRKNWSSVMLFDNAQCQALTPEYVNHASGLELHRFHWIKDDQIGMLPLDWNWLVGEYEPNPNAKVLHYTLGTPCFPGYGECDQADLWWAEAADMMRPLYQPV